MKSVRNLRTGFTIAIISALAIVNKEIIDANKIIEIFQLQDYRFWVIFFSVLVLSSFVVPLFLYLFDKYIWKWFFVKQNFSGIWHYVNIYHEDKGRSNTSGFVKIEQTPFEIKIVQGLSDKKSETENYPARVESTSGTIYLDSGRLLFSYEVTRIGNDGVWHVTKRSIEGLKVTSRTFWGKPVELRGQYWNCVRTRAEMEEIKSGGIPDFWPPAVGKSRYLRSSKKEMKKSINLSKVFPQTAGR